MEPSSLDGGILNSQLFKNIEELAQDNLNAPVYKHSVLYPLCNKDFLSEVHNEITANMKANFKETDLFKLFQTAELGSLEETILEKEMPSLLKLRKILYSEEFRQFISKITNCSEELNEILTDRVDCSINAYSNSCHLLCHDDVIGTRCVSYIIYLSNPEEEWKAEDGGAVELYALDKKSIITQEIKKEKDSSSSGIDAITLALLFL
jgi:Rps23 Pro-64 3,4-dihydroxylase Tpa1-like proline 4-hydroxylase